MGRNILRQSLWLTFLLIGIHSALAQTRFILRAPANSVPTIAARHGLLLRCTTNPEGVTCTQNLDSRTPDQILAELGTDPDVQHAEVDGTALLPESRAAFQPSQPAGIASGIVSGGQTPVLYFGGSVWTSYVSQPAAVLIRVSDVQRIPATGSGIVAVIDTGVDPGQPVLLGSLVPGYDFVNNVAGIPSEWNDLNPSTAAVLNQVTAGTTPVQLNQSTAAILDQSTAAILDITQVPAAFGHGTMVAGVIHLAAPTAHIMPLKAFRADGSANLSDIVRAIYFAVDNGAQVINMSFSLTASSLELMKAVNYATAHNVVCVGSVGNDGSETLVYPAAFHNVIGVASTDNLDNRSRFSNYGQAVAHIAAPGEGIVTTYPGGNYAVVSGTSFSAPLVSAGAALMLQVDYNLSPSEALQAVSNAKRLTPDLGFGRLDLFQAVRSLVNH